jgi:choline dehydrogenase-like flavoprotein
MINVEEFELLILGGGKAGKTLAMDMAHAGRRVAVIERGLIGGSCINVASIPTKALSGCRIVDSPLWPELSRIGHVEFCAIPPRSVLSPSA